MKTLTEIKDQIRDEERAFYGSRDCVFSNIQITGLADGESAFKECRNIIVKNSSFFLRYPFWHNNNLIIDNAEFKDTARAALWYCDKVALTNINGNGIKALRECRNINIKNSNFVSDEFGWNINNLELSNCKIKSIYAFMYCKKVKINYLHFIGKYSFQYVHDMTINNSELDTKDAFWHSKNVTVKNSIIKGEYLGWYSENLTLINCVISGTQPLCYAKNLRLIDCKTEGCDLSFENTTVRGNIIGDVVSIKNPLKGKLVITGKTEYISDDFDKGKYKFKLVSGEN